MGTSISWGATCDGLASHPGGNRNILSCFMPRRPDIKTGLANGWKQNLFTLVSNQHS